MQMRFAGTQVREVAEMGEEFEKAKRIMPSMPPIEGIEEGRAAVERNLKEEQAVKDAQAICGRNQIPNN